MGLNEYTLLGIKAGVDENGQVYTEASGPLGSLIAEMAEYYYKNLNTQKVLAQREGGNVYTCYQPPTPTRAGFKVACNKLLELVAGRFYPSTATVAITKACQCDCIHCSASEFMRSGRRPVTKEEMFSLIDQAQELGVNNIVFTGGEPLLHPHILDFIRHVDYEEARPMMFTNGLGLTDERIEELLEAGLYSMMVSLDSVDPNRHDEWRRMPGCWQRAVDGARRAREAGLLVGFSTYADPEKVRNGELEEMLELTRECNLHELTIFDTVPTGRFLDLDESRLLSEEDKLYIKEFSQKANEAEGLPGVKAQSFVNSADGHGCFAAYFQFYMTAAGDITPCDFTPLTFGNITEEPLRTIWERMTSHEAFKRRCDHCRMQDLEFRAKYIEPIKEDAQLPFPMYEREEAASLVAG